MNAVRLGLALTLPVLLAACATPLLGPECTRFGRDGQLCLLPPAALPAVEGSHMVKVLHAGHEDAFMGLLHIDARDLRLAGFSLFGTSLFNLDFDGSKVTSVPTQDYLQPELLVAMLELAIADPAELQGRLHGLTLQVRTDGGAEIREVYEGDRLIAHLEKRGAGLAESEIRIDIPPAKVSVEMTPLAAAPAPP